MKMSIVAAICTIYISYLITTIIAIANRDYIAALWHNQRNMTWIQANDYCKNTYNSTLATVLTYQDLELAYSYNYYGGFIGLNDMDEDDQWSWIDDSPCQVTNINNSEMCTDFYRDRTAYTNGSLCSRLAFGGLGWAIEDLPCNEYYRQFYCNKIRGYIYESTKMNQSDAEQYCRSNYGTNLATVTENDLSNLDVIPAPVGFIDTWVGLMSNNGKLGWIDGTEFDSDNILVDINTTSTCNSVNYNDQAITGEYSCNQTLPFLCNRRPKAREYILYQEQKTFKQAQTICENLHGTDLATVITEEEFSDVLRMLPNIGATWIGLRQVDGQFKWVDGTNCSENNALCVPYWNQFDDVMQNECAFIYANGASRSTSCDNSIELKNFLCNKPIGDIAPIVNVTEEPIFNTTSVPDGERWLAGICGFTVSETPVFDIDIPVDVKFIYSMSSNYEPPTAYWNAYQDQILQNQSWTEMMLEYEDLGEWNYNTSTIVLGNIIFCVDDNSDLCIVLPKIGPNNFPDELTRYFPVTMNGYYDLDTILLLRDPIDGDEASDMINIWAHFYAIYTDESSRDKIKDVINSTVFPNGKNTNMASSIEPMIGEWITYPVMYVNIEDVYKDVGDPNDWNVRFNDYYFVVEGYNDLVIYMIGISASFPNRTILDDYLRYVPMTQANTTGVTKETPRPPPKEDDNAWMIVGIVFVVLFAIALGIIIYLLWDKNKSGYKGYAKTSGSEVEMKNTTQIYSI